MTEEAEVSTPGVVTIETELEAAAVVGLVGDATLLDTAAEVLLETAEDDDCVLPLLQDRL